MYKLKKEKYLGDVSTVQAVNAIGPHNSNLPLNFLLLVT